MIERRFVRVLTVYSKTTFFVDKGSQLGLVPDSFQLFEDDLNKKLNDQERPRPRHLRAGGRRRSHPGARSTGRGDIVAAGKLATAWRKEQVDFANATRTGISSIVVTGPGVPPIASVHDLSGKEVYLRASDVSAQNVARVQRPSSPRPGKPPVRIKPAPEVLSDEDLLEMVNAGLAPMTMVDDYVAEFWKQIFPGIGAQHVGGGPHRRRDGDDGPQEQPAS